MEGGEYMDKTGALEKYRIFELVIPYIIMIFGAIGIVRCVLSNRCVNSIMDESDDLKMDDFGISICNTEIIRYKVSQV